MTKELDHDKPEDDIFKMRCSKAKGHATKTLGTKTKTHHSKA